MVVSAADPETFDQDVARIVRPAKLGVQRSTIYTSRCGEMVK
jgi:hypothetical protein